MIDLTYQRNRDVILNRAKPIMKMIKKDYESMREINIETHLKKKKHKKRIWKKQTP